MTKTTTSNSTPKIHKVISENVKTNMREVIMEEGGAYYTRHIALDASKPTRPKRRTYGSSHR